MRAGPNTPYCTPYRAPPLEFLAMTHILSPDQLKRHFVQSATPLHLGLMVSPTEQCNFRCTYCYEDFELKRMSDAVYDALKRFVERSLPGLRSFSLSWFGGEPLLEWQRMAEFTSYCRSLAHDHGVQMSWATTPTNAWSLTADRLGHLVAAGVGEFMVSLDGERSVHDQTRHLISGRGTFDRIYANLLAARDASIELPFRIILRLHLHRDNLESQRALALRLYQDFGHDQRFMVHPITLGDFGGPTIHTMNLLPNHDSHAIEQEIVTLFGRTQSFDMESEVHAVCYAAKPNHILVRPNGQLAKCTSALGRADNEIGQLLLDGSLSVDANKARLWSFGFQTGQREHLSCPFHDKPREHPLQFVRNVS
jgi:uncharacterized protein